MIWTASRRPDVFLVSHAELLKLWELSGPLECPSWNKPQGPISRAVVSLKRAGWHAGRPLSWINHREREGARFCSQARSPPGTRATLGLIWGAVGPNARMLNRFQKYLVKSCGCGGVGTNERARHSGHSFDGLR
eukprot:4167408-Pyramimonas_sp.AAC.1